MSIDTPHRDTVGMSQIMRRLSAHLAVLADEVRDIESALDLDALPQDLITDEQILRVQRLDFLRQSLVDAAILMTNMSTQTLEAVLPGTSLDRISAGLVLDSTRNILRNSDKLTGDLRHNASRTDIELF